MYYLLNCLIFSSNLEFHKQITMSQATPGAYFNEFFNCSLIQKVILTSEKGDCAEHRLAGSNTQQSTFKDCQWQLTGLKISFCTFMLLRFDARRKRKYQKERSGKLCVV